MTFHLASFRLRSIGERSARFTDWTLNTADPAGIPQDHLIWLRNGGGKSSLLSLFYALVLPKRTDFMGRSLDRSLADYVDTGDTSHTIAVWHPTSGAGGKILVTGAVYEWDDLRRPANTSHNSDRLGRSFYAFFVVPGELDADILPVTDAAGHLLRRSDYIAQLRALTGSRSVAEFISTETLGDWERALTERHLDPDLFRAQKKMNHVEGGVENVFSFTSAKDFINFLINLTVSPEVTGDLTASIGQIGEKIARKPAMTADRSFCLAAAAGLEDLSTAHHAHQTAGAEVVAATWTAKKLSAQFAAAISHAHAELEDLGAQEAALNTERTRLNTSRTNTTDLAFLYREQASGLRLAEVQQQFEHAKTVLLEARRRVTVWRATGPVAAYREATGQLDEARAAAEKEAVQLTPLAVAHDNQAEAYKVLLEVLAAADVRHASEARTAAETARRQARDAAALAKAAHIQASEAARTASRYQTLLDRFNEDLRRAVTRRVLPDARVSPREHLDTLATERDRQLEKLSKIRARRDERPGLRRALDEELIDLESSHFQTAHDRKEISKARGRYAAEARDLAHHPRTLALVEASPESPVNLWADADALLRSLVNEIRRADLAIITEKVSRAESERVLEAHAETGYLPSTRDADRITGVLLEARIAAEPGWKHLLSLLAADRLVHALNEPLLGRIGAGVVVPTSQAEAARNALDAAGETTVALVAVFTAAAAGEAVNTYGKSGAMASPHAWSAMAPGLIDKGSAESEAATLRAGTRTGDNRIAALNTDRIVDQRLHDQIAGFLAKCPSGTIESLDHQISDLDGDLAGISMKIDANRLARKDMETVDKDDAAEEAAINNSITVLNQYMTLLEMLARDAESVPAWEAGREGANALELSSEQEAARHEASAASANNQASDHDTEAARYDWFGDGYKNTASRITFIGSPTKKVTAQDVTGEDLETLRRRTKDARHAYDLPASEYRAAARVTMLSDHLAELRAGLPDDAGIRAEAEAALATPEGQSQQNRISALVAAEDGLSHAEQDLGVAREKVLDAQKAVAEFGTRRPGVTRRPTPVEPSDELHATALAEEQEAKASVERDELSANETSLSGLKSRRNVLENLTTSIGILSRDLPKAETAVDEVPFPGDTPAADAARTAALDVLNKARDRAADIEKQVVSLISDLKITAANYQDVPAKARDRLLHDGPAVLSANAGKLAADLRMRALQIDADLDSIAADQAIVTRILAGAVIDNFDMINRTRRFSSLPEGLGTLSGKPLLKIKYTTATDTDLLAVVNQVIEASLAKGNKPDGMDLLKSAVHAAVGVRGFTVKVLKPVHDVSPVEEDVDALGKWSGGERLTAGIALYCTIAKVRAVNTGNKDRVGGMLVLDNPIGRASYGPLIDLQRKVAAAQGIQLIYATGVKDFDAVSHFPGITRLDNRPGSAGNRRYIVETADETGSSITGARAVHS